MIETSWPTVYEQIQSCRLCPLHQGIRNKVPGQGNPKARLLIVGEGPGAEEDRLGLAFVGPAGQLLTRMLEAIDLSRDEVYIANVVKCRPPDNRVPLPEEANCCLPYLRAQTALIRPKVILILGGTALKYLVDDQARITRVRGQWIHKKGIWLLPAYHPSALLRDPLKKKDAWSDMKLLRDKLKELEMETGDGA